MADAVVDLQASNIFALEDEFNTQSSTETIATENKPTNDESGNVACQRNVNEQTDYTQSATYCGASTTPGQFIAAMDTFLTEFGNFQAVGVVTGLSINMTAGEYATFDITGHQHTENEHVAGYEIGHADVSDFLPHDTEESFESWDGFGVPDFGLALATTATPTSATVTFSMNHVDVPDQNGDHFVGKNITPRCELSMSFEGAVVAMSASTIQGNLRANAAGMYDVIVDSFDQGDANSAFDTFSFTAHANTDITIDPA